MDLQHSEVEGLCRFRYISYYINIQILIRIDKTVSLYNFVLSIIYEFCKPTPLRSYWCGMRNMSTWNSFPFIALRSCIWKRPAIEEMGDRRDHRRDGRGSENNKCSGLRLRNYILNSYYPFLSFEVIM